MDIEAALHWAFGVVQIDRVAWQIDRFGRDSLAVLAEIGLPRGPGFRSASDMMRRVTALGILVREGGAPRAIGTSTGGRWADRAAAEDGDALAILDAVTECPEIWLQIVDEGVVLWDRASIAAAGMDLVEAAHPFLRAGDDHRPVESANVLAALIANARLGLAMDWNTVTLASAPRRRGRPTAEETERAHRQWHRLVLARARYSAWHMALRWLVERLEGRLTTIEVTGPRAPAAPWHVSTLSGPGISDKIDGDKPLKRCKKKSA